MLYKSWNGAKLRFRAERLGLYVAPKMRSEIFFLLYTS